MMCALRNCSDPLYRVFDVDITVRDFLGLCVQKIKVGKNVSNLNGYRLLTA